MAGFKGAEGRTVPYGRNISAIPVLWAEWSMLGALTSWARMMKCDDY